MAVRWARWWIWMWGVVAVGLIVLAFLIPFKWWALAALVGFGSMEAIGLAHPNDAYPPLTHVIRRYVPRWLAFTAIYGVTGAAGGVWLDFAAPTRLGLLFALVGWLTTHFDVTFDQEIEAEERAKHRRLVRPILRAFSSKRRTAGEPQAGVSGQERH